MRNLTIAGWARLRSYLFFLVAAVLTGGWVGSVPAAARQDDTRMPIEEEARPQRSSNRSSANRGRQAADLKRTFQPVVQQVAGAVVRVDVEDRQVALGTVVSSDGRLVTKSSLVPDEIVVRWSNDQQAPARLVARSEELDLAIFQWDVAEPLAAVDLTSPGSVPAGGFVITPGANGDVRYLGVAATTPREFRMGRRGNRGRSGNGFLGVQTTTLESEPGLAITQVVPNSAALRAGLRPGDRITHIEDTLVESSEQLASLLSARRPGEEIVLRLHRDNQEISVVAKLGEAEAAASMYDRWGGGPFSERRFGFPEVIPHDTPLQPHECGGPLVNSRGEVVGINISRALRIATYALPLDAVAGFVNEHR